MPKTGCTTYLESDDALKLRKVIAKANRIEGSYISMSEIIAALVHKEMPNFNLSDNPKALRAQALNLIGQED